MFEYSSYLGYLKLYLKLAAQNSGSVFSHSSGIETSEVKVSAGWLLWKALRKHVPQPFLLGPWFLGASLQSQPLSSHGFPLCHCVCVSQIPLFFLLQGHQLLELEPTLHSG